MPFVKLDCGMLDSTLWVDRVAREVFITALLMAEPFESSEAMPQIAVKSLDFTGWEAPAGCYGFVPASGVGIVRRSGVEAEAGADALERLGNPEPESRSPEFEGRRMVRINGGYLILNYAKYRERDYTSAARSQRYRERIKQKRHAVASTSHAVTDRSVTHADAEAYKKNPRGEDLKRSDERKRQDEPALKALRERYGSELVAKKVSS